MSAYGDERPLWQ